jgi:hypothetical protein
VITARERLEPITAKDAGMATKAPPIDESTLVVRPANEVGWEDLE